MTPEISSRQFEIIEAAAKLLSTHGMSGLTIKNLAKEMHFSEGALYRHFSSKEDIVVVMIQYVRDNVDKRFLAKSKTTDDVLSQFKQMLTMQFMFFKENPHLAMVIFSDGLLDESKKVSKLIMQIMEERSKILLPILARGQKEGVFTKTLNSDELVHIIFGAIRLQMFKWRVGQFQDDITRLGNRLLATLLKILLVK